MCQRGGVGVGVGGSVAWNVDRCVGSIFVNTDGITFGIDDGYDMGSSDGSFYV